VSASKVPFSKKKRDIWEGIEIIRRQDPNHTPEEDFREGVRTSTPEALLRVAEMRCMVLITECACLWRERANDTQLLNSLRAPIQTISTIAKREASSIKKEDMMPLDVAAGTISGWLRQIILLADLLGQGTVEERKYRLGVLVDRCEIFLS
jgi:hypothetical protein